MEGRSGRNACVPSTIFHIAHRSEWEGRGTAYRPDAFDSDGFVHGSTGDQIADTLSTWFEPGTDLVLVAFDESDLDVRWVDSHGDHRRFPHVHEPIPMDTVRWTIPFGGPDRDLVHSLAAALAGAAPSHHRDQMEHLRGLLTT